MRKPTTGHSTRPTVRMRRNYLSRLFWLFDVVDHGS
jgi:hypothetical protein